MDKREIRRIQAMAVVAVTLAFIGFRSLPLHKGAAVPQAGKEDFRYVSRVVDGDTLKLSGGERVRLIGVDTPEVHYSEKLLRDSKRNGRDAAAIQAMGARASEFTKSLVSGRKVRLEFDVERRDRYGRLLAYVYLEDGTFVNARIIEEGYGQVMTIPPNVKYADRFLELQRDARQARKGLWGEGGGL
jgi:micrococcal nuclease